jgi:hypothetical protein
MEIDRLNELYNDAGKEMFVLHEEIDRLNEHAKAIYWKGYEKFLVGKGQT